mmetsp:Transcript_14244/g.57347  ORF Transcript_14244/g.57347 Transcript_14244/m.57347 type:complete len:200 (+) Transcript_14244:823-1422(+)
MQFCDKHLHHWTLEGYHLLIPPHHLEALPKQPLPSPKNPLSRFKPGQNVHKSTHLSTQFTTTRRESFTKPQSLHLTCTHSSHSFLSRTDRTPKHRFQTVDTNLPFRFPLPSPVTTPSPPFRIPRITAGARASATKYSSRILKSLAVLLRIEVKQFSSNFLLRRIRELSYCSMLKIRLGTSLDSLRVLLFALPEHWKVVR